MQRLRRVFVIAGLVGLGAAFTLILPSRSQDPSTPTARPARSIDGDSRPTRSSTRGVEVGFVVGDGLELAGQLFQADRPASPVVILLHRWGGSREEMRPLVAPILARLPDVHVLLLDLRGHGQSTQRRGDTREVTFNNMVLADRQKMSNDVLAAMLGLEARLKARAPGFIVIGSDIGSTIAAQVMAEHPRVVGLGLVSPGPQLNGLDLYAALASARGKMGLVMAATKDNVSAEPLRVVATMMGDRARAVPLEGDGHGAGIVANQHPELWELLANWTAEVRGTIRNNPAVEVPPDAVAPAETVEPVVVPAGSISADPSARAVGIVSGASSSRKPSEYRDPRSTAPGGR